MKHVSILIPKGHFSLVNVEGTHHVFSTVNGILQQQDRPPLFKLHLVGLEKPVTQTTGLFSIHPELLLKDVPKTDLIVIPAIHGSLEANLQANAEFLPWIKKQYKEGAEVVSYCIGTMFLASTGLLNGKQCATHWQYLNQFRQLYPEANVIDDKIITDDSGIYTSGGAYSFTNLLVYLVEKFAGREMAIIIAKAFMIDIDRNSQSPFLMFAGQKNHHDAEVLKAQEYIEQHFTDKITVDDLADKFGVGRRTFERRFKKTTANTVVEYIQRVKTEAAKKQLETGRKTVNEVMYEVGYTDTKAFRDVFRKYTGLSPIEYRSKYNKEAVVG